MQPSMDSIRTIAPFFALVVVLVFAYGVIQLQKLASETEKRACVEKAQARYPAIPVSAFTRNRTAVGPLKVSFVAERAKAVSDCD